MSRTDRLAGFTHRVRLLFALALLLVALVAFTATALAAAPSNDTFPNAKLVTLGFSETLDTTEATTDSDDAQLLETCPAPVTDASVWYAIGGSHRRHRQRAGGRSRRLVGRVVAERRGWTITVREELVYNMPA